MDIKLTAGSYKSIRSLHWRDVPEFAVVTGRNGSGKTQLLELINFHLGVKAKDKRNQLSNKNNPFVGVNLEITGFEASDTDVVYLPANWTLQNIGAVNASTFSSTISALHQHIVGVKVNAAYSELASIVYPTIGKEKTNITLADVQEHLPLDHFDYINDIQLHEGLNEASMHHYLKIADLRMEGLSDEDVEDRIGEAPWETLNQILDEASFPYYLTRPKTLIGNFASRLVMRKDETTTVDYSDLSSGEKILISLALWMFNSSKAKRLPKLLLLDEPDAHLHPSGIRQFINVIEKNLVRKHGVRVIMSTHSPTTVSFSPEYALFEMSRSAPQISPLSSKEYGISLLSDGLVTVKRNTKYVLVEDIDDANFYSSAFKVLHGLGLVNTDIGVMFIPASNKNSNTSGGASVVEAWVQKFTEEGVFDVFSGLIDQDNDNQPKPNIRVIGRYSIENYMLDPIIVFASIIHDDTEFSIPSISIGHKNEHKIGDLNADDLQLIADFILAEVESSLTGLDDEAKEFVLVKFVNGITLRYPKWLVTKRGHDLFQKFRAKFDKPIAYDRLTNAMRRHDFIPVDLCDAMVAVQQSDQS